MYLTGFMLCFEMTTCDILLKTVQIRTFIFKSVCFSIASLTKAAIFQLFFVRFNCHVVLPVALRKLPVYKL